MNETHKKGEKIWDTWREQGSSANICNVSVNILPFNAKVASWNQDIVYLEDEFGVVGGHFFDVHTSLWAPHHDGTITGAVHQNGEVGLPGNVQSLSDHHLEEEEGRRVEMEEWGQLRYQRDFTNK